MHIRRNVTAGAVLIALASLLFAACTNSDVSRSQAEPNEPAVASSSGEPQAAESEPPPLFTSEIDVALLGEGLAGSPIAIHAPGRHAAWTVVGSVRDPATGLTHATVWDSPDLERAMQWSRIHLVDVGSTDAVSTVAGAVHDVGSRRWILGREGSGQDARPLVWARADQGWEVLELKGLTDQEFTPHGLASDPTGTGVLIWGRDNDLDNSQTRVSVSADGHTFTQSAQDIFADYEALREVIHTGETWLAVGSDRSSGTSTIAVWVSPDGLSWTRAPSPPAVGTRSYATAAAVHAGRIYLGGVDSTDEGLGRATVWTSDDHGHTWSNGEALPLRDDNRLTLSDFEIHAFSQDETRGLVAIGGTSFRPHVWNSIDGRSWSLLPSPLQPAGFATGVDLVDIAAGHGTVITVASDPGIFRLVDDYWTEVGLQSTTMPIIERRPHVRGAMRGDNGDLFVVGYTTTPAVRGSEPRTIPAIWRRGVEGEWTSQDLPGQGGVARGIIAHAGGLLAVGNQDFATSSKSLGDQNPNGLMWWSANGDEWLPVAPGLEIPDDAPTTQRRSLINAYSEHNPIAGIGNFQISTLSVVGDGFAIGGSSFGPGDETIMPLLVISPDGRSAHRDEEIAELEPGASISAVCTDADNAMIVVGGVDDPRGEANALVWHRSPDGTWTKRTNPDGSMSGSGGQSIIACAHDGARFLAVGVATATSKSNAAMWISDDGIEWSSIKDDALTSDRSVSAVSVASLPYGGFIVAGNDNTLGDIVLWHVSSDGSAELIDTGDDDLSMPYPQSADTVIVADDEVWIIGSAPGRLGFWRSPALYSMLVAET